MKKRLVYVQVQLLICQTWPIFHTQTKPFSLLEFRQREKSKPQLLTTFQGFFPYYNGHFTLGGDCEKLLFSSFSTTNALIDGELGLDFPLSRGWALFSLTLFFACVLQVRRSATLFPHICLTWEFQGGQHLPQFVPTCKSTYPFMHNSSNVTPFVRSLFSDLSVLFTWRPICCLQGFSFRITP